MPILAASCIGRSAEQYAEGVFVGKVLGVIPLAYSELLNRQNAFLSLCNIHRITLSSSHRHGKTCDKEYTSFFHFLHFSLPKDAIAALIILWQTCISHGGKSPSCLEADLPIATLHHCTKSSARPPLSSCRHIGKNAIGEHIHRILGTGTKQDNRSTHLFQPAPYCLLYKGIGFYPTPCVTSFHIPMGWFLPTPSRTLTQRE